MESISSIPAPTIGGLGIGAAAGLLLGGASRSVPGVLAVGGITSLLGGAAVDQLQQVADKHDVSGLALAAKPSVSLGVASGVLGAGAIGVTVSQGSSPVMRAMTIAGSAIVGAATALAGLNLINVE